jgi:hypothetical protein
MVRDIGSAANCLPGEGIMFLILKIASTVLLIALCAVSFLALAAEQNHSQENSAPTEDW